MTSTKRRSLLIFGDGGGDGWHHKSGDGYHRRHFGNDGESGGYHEFGDEGDWTDHHHGDEGDGPSC